LIRPFCCNVTWLTRFSTSFLLKLLSVFLSFSQVLRSQLIRPNKPIIRTSEPVSLHPWSRLKRVVLPLPQVSCSFTSHEVVEVRFVIITCVFQALPVFQRMKLRPRKRRRSVWTRLGGLQLTRHLSYCSLPGFWSFRNKYTLRARSSTTYRSEYQQNHWSGSLQAA
ncbi:hypothetical protein XENOCAPTIV_009797, partial [Xenoophorus captivus]